MDEVSSVRSERSSSVHRSSSNSYHQNNPQLQHHGGGGGHRSGGGGRRQSNNSSHGHHRENRNNGRQWDSRIDNGGGGGGDRNGHQSGDELLLSRDEVIQVAPQDDNWGESTTCVTGNTSERSCSYDDVRHAKEFNRRNQHGGVFWEENVIAGRMRCVGRYCGVIVVGAICLLTFLTPIVMVVLPKTSVIIGLGHHQHHSSADENRPGEITSTSSATTSWTSWNTTVCTPDCEGLLISFTVKLSILLIGMWALFFRRSMENLPRLVIGKALLSAFVFLITFAYWLFYGVRIVQRREENYTSIVTFAHSLVDAMLFVHYLAVIILEVRQLRSQYRIRVVRSPDGESRTYSIGQLSIQSAAVKILRNYYRDFSVYNPFLERIPGSGRMKKGGGGGGSAHGSQGPNMGTFKVYDVDGVNSLGPPPVSAQAIMAAAARKRDASHNDRFYEEMDWERRVKKRKARLVTAAEEAFSHVKRLHEEKGPCVPMDAHEAAQAVFPSLARSLQKYLRVTRQQPRHTAENVVRHLAQCLSYDVSPRAFLERFFSTQETYEAFQEQTKWSIVCEQLVSRNVAHGAIFQLRCHCPGPEVGVYLLCTVTRMPFMNLTEEPFDPKNDKFVLRLNSETSV